MSPVRQLLLHHLLNAISVLYIHFSDLANLLSSFPKLVEACSSAVLLHSKDWTHLHLAPKYN